MRGEKYLSSVDNVHRLLTHITESPEQYISDGKWEAMTHTIHTMCAFEDESLNIKKCAPNTFKRVAANTILGGFTEVDRLRKLAKVRLSQASTPQKKQKTKSRRVVAVENKSQKMRLQRLETSFAQMQIVLQDLRDLSYQLAHDDSIPNKPNYWKRRMREITSIFQLVGGGQ
ncbi:hypothetical protein [Pseudomonas mandelii]|uniref:hypothetical protein n=1 Tax=Pseudomonas mandelii TaxID=75612 RepID=UPI00112D4CE1|nr:hypothetical protein [Pseudomonas mandelii]